MGTVMIVDDAAILRAILKRIILQSGHEVIAEASNGEEAINQYPNAKPDLVIMDITMPPTPSAKDGIEALKKIISANPTAKIVMCSAMSQPALIVEALKSGAKDFIAKPFQPQKIREVLSQYC
ncbi:response regulator [Candidatus Bathyarchaeota archaeon]|nr:response regulator [Candidatus Bathyarchaeota archaeon]